MEWPVESMFSGHDEGPLDEAVSRRKQEGPCWIGSQGKQGDRKSPEFTGLSGNSFREASLGGLHFILGFPAASHD